MSARETVAVIGAGSWGTTLAKIIGEGAEKTLLWARRQDLAREINESHTNPTYLPDVELPPSVEATHDLERCCRSSKLILLVVPSHGLREVANALGDFVTGEHMIVHATKGIERGSFKRMSEVLREETCVRKLGVLAGPNLAKELTLRQPAGTLVASPFDEVFRRFHAALQSDYFRVYWGQDVVGAEVGGAFKNIVALAAGVSHGMGMGENTKALLLTRGLNEMARLGAAMGADPLTFGGMAGIGDLMATCSSQLSRNFQVGLRLSRGETLEEIQTQMNMVAEGVKTTRAVRDYTAAKGIDLPIVDAVHRLLYEGGNVRALVKDLMSIPTGEEFVGLSTWRPTAAA